MPRRNLIPNQTLINAAAREDIRKVTAEFVDHRSTDDGKQLERVRETAKAIESAELYAVPAIEQLRGLYEGTKNMFQKG